MHAYVAQDHRHHRRLIAGQGKRMRAALAAALIIISPRLHAETML
jgi:hypothetical protein